MIVILSHKEHRIADNVTKTLNKKITPTQVCAEQRLEIKEEINKTCFSGDYIFIEVIYNGKKALSCIYLYGTLFQRKSSRAQYNYTKHTTNKLKRKEIMALYMYQ